MTAEQFAYWMQGFAELNSEPPTAAQWQSMREHLATVFVKVTPPVDLSRLPAAVPYVPGIVKDGPNHHMRPGIGSPPLQWPNIAMQPLRTECSTTC